MIVREQMISVKCNLRTAIFFQARKMSSLSIVSPERRIELNPFDVDAWNLLLRESQVIFLPVVPLETLFSSGPRLSTAKSGVASHREISAEGDTKQVSVLFSFLLCILVELFLYHIFYSLLNKEEIQVDVNVNTYYIKI